MSELVNTSKRKTDATIFTHIILAVVATSWGVNNIVMKVGFQYLTAPQFSGIRLLITLPFMLFLAFWMPSRVKFERKDFWRIVLVGALGLGIFQIFFPIGIDQTSTPVGGILMATMPIQVAIISVLFRLERPGWKSITGIMLTVIGLLLLSLSASGSEVDTQSTILGIFLVVFAETGYAINTTFLRPYMKKYPPLQVTGLAMAVSVILFQLVYFPQLLKLRGTTIPPIAWATTIYSGMVAFLISNILWNLSIRKIGSTKVAVYGNLPPVIVMILSAIILKDIMSPLQMLGALVILFGVVLVNFKSERPLVQTR